MAAPQVSPIPTPPTRGDAEGTFVPLANDFLGAFPLLQSQVNIVADFVGERADAAETAATTAAADAATASDAKDSALAVVDYAGVWSALTGSLAAGQSVSHLGAYWRSTTSIADVTLSEPGYDNTDWLFIYRNAERRRELLERASMRMGFATNTYKLISDVGLSDSSLGSILTYTRASVAHRTDHRGLLDELAVDAPRVTYDPITGVCAGLLVENTSTNLIFPSEDFSDAAWSATGVTVSVNAATAADGAVTADKLVESALNETHRVSVPSASITSGLDYTSTVFVEADERSVIQFVPSGSFFPITYANFNLVTGTVSASGSNITATLKEFPGGIWRCRATVTAIASGTNVPGFWLVSNSPTLPRFTGYAGDGASGLFVWGGMFSQSFVPLSYIATTTTALTRDDDDPVRTLGSEASPRSGSIVVEARMPPPANDAFGHRFFSLNDGTTNNRITLLRGSNSSLLRAFVSANGSVTTVDFADFDEGEVIRIAFRYSQSEIVFNVNGVEYSSAFPDTLSADLGFVEIGGEQSQKGNTTTSDFQYYRVELTSDELQELAAP